MYIVLDASILSADYNLNSGYNRTLFENAERFGHTICIAELTIEETVANYSKELRKHLSISRRHIGNLNRLLPDAARHPQIDVECKELEGAYRTFLRESLAAANVLILPYPRTDHRELVYKAIYRTRPFDENGSGYRDALLWSCLKELLQKGNRLALIAADKDFVDKEGRLHPDLCQDLQHNGVNHSLLTVYNDVASLIDEVIKPLLSICEVLIGESDGQSGLAAQAMEAIQLHIQEFYQGDEWDPEQLGFSWEYGSPSLDLVEGLKINEVSQGRRLPSGEMLVRVGATLDAEFDVFINKADYYIIDDDDLHVWNHDWNDHVVAGSKTVEMTGEFDLIIDPSGESVSNVDIFSIEAIDPEQ